jgi:hypothetical protein
LSRWELFGSFAANFVQDQHLAPGHSGCVSENGGKQMHDWLMNFLSVTEPFVEAAIAVMPADIADSLYRHALALTVVLLALRIGRKKESGSVLHKPVAEALKGTLGRREHPALSALKTCPKCAVQLPLSTLVCDSCDYNFLSRTIGSRHRLLPAPNVAASNG